ncbi:hypothetical protein [Streptomyces sp. NPDC047453]|uniref:hypothetical protein n=1 Tax=Streptomyces sp. NPDC047453 TaxID=3154812 RepID=UPI003400FFF2
MRCWRLAKLSEDHELVSARHGDNYAPLMRRHFRSHRKVLLDLTETLQMVATSTDDCVLQAVEFCQAMRHRGSQGVPVTYTVAEEGGTEKTKTVSADFASQMWQRILFDKHKPGKINRRHFEVCTLFYRRESGRPVCGSMVTRRPHPAGRGRCGNGIRMNQPQAVPLPRQRSRPPQPQA